MLKLLKYILLLLTITVLLFSCKNSKCFKTAGQEVCQIREKTENYSKIEVNGKLDLCIENDTTTSEQITISGRKNLVNFVKTDIHNNILYVDNTNKCNWLRSYKKSKIEVFVPQSKLNHLRLKGQGKVYSIDTLTNDSLKIEFSTGISDIDLKVKVNKLEIVIHDGAGDIIIKGKANEIYIYNNGYAYLDLSNIECNYMFLANKSQNKTLVNVKSRLDVEIYDVGNVYCYNNPQTINLKQIGKGDLIIIN